MLYNMSSKGHRKLNLVKKHLTKGAPKAPLFSCLRSAKNLYKYAAEKYHNHPISVLTPNIIRTLSEL